MIAKILNVDDSKPDLARSGGLFLLVKVSVKSVKVRLIEISRLVCIFEFSYKHEHPISEDI